MYHYLLRYPEYMDCDNPFEEVTRNEFHDEFKDLSWQFEYECLRIPFGKGCIELNCN